MKTNKLIVASILIALVVGVVIGAKVFSTSDSGNNNKANEDSKAEAGLWTCSMHPQIKLPKPGSCPICGMDLIPIEKDKKTSPRSIFLSEQAVKLAKIQTVPATKMFVAKEVRMVGKIEFDETRLKYITAWIPGRLDRLYVDYTGVPVQKGDHLVNLYSEELLSGQQELIESVKAVENLKGSSSESALSMAKSTLEATKEKLRLWGLTEEQVQNISKQKTPTDHITIHSPISGIVIQKNLNQGAYVKTGDKIYTVADLSKVWVKMDAYESDIEWLRYGQQVQFEVNAYSGKKFTGTISFIDPILNEKTRTVKVRVNVDNKDGTLKPGMFVQAVVLSKLAMSGKVMDSALAGKWISPMHPEIIKDGPGKCEICGMPLVKAETLGYASADQNGEAPLVIPTSAPLITGKRAVVYVEDPNEKGRYMGKEVQLGPRAGNFYIVNSGLNVGDKVVVNGNFKIDSAIQILGKPSMMNPQENGSDNGTQQPANNSSGKTPAPKKFRQQLSDVYTAYFKVHTALSKDNFKTALSEVKNLEEVTNQTDMKLLNGKSNMHLMKRWMKLLKEITSSLKNMKHSKDIQSMRENFALLSESLISIVSTFGSDGKISIYRAHCPMAFKNRGADWLQEKKEIANPYFGASMYGCGAVEETLYEPKK